jgi:hypothetical protein
MKKLKGRAKSIHKPSEAKGFTLVAKSRKKLIIIIVLVLVVLTGVGVWYRANHQPIDPRFIDSHGGVLSPELRQDIDAPSLDPSQGSDE